MALQNNQQKDKSIDEQYLMSMMAGEEKTKPGPELPRTPEKHKNAPKKEKRSREKGTGNSYEELFLKNADTMARTGKSVYIRPEFHERLSRIVQVIGEDKITIYAYLDNLLEYHFKEFGSQITESFNDKYKPIL